MIEVLNERYGRLADPDRADLLGLDKLDAHELAARRARQYRRRHPPRGAAAGDHDRPNAIVGAHAAATWGAAHVRAMKSEWSGRDSVCRSIISRRWRIPAMRRSLSTRSTIGS